MISLGGTLAQMSHTGPCSSIWVEFGHYNRKRERDHIPESLILDGVIWKEKYGCGAQRIREKGFAL